MSKDGDYLKNYIQGFKEAVAESQAYKQRQAAAKSELGKFMHHHIPVSKVSKVNYHKVSGQRDERFPFGVMLKLDDQKSGFKGHKHVANEGGHIGRRGL
jgi:hypothetical protein